jgi:hypothetical protein
MGDCADQLSLFKWAWMVDRLRNGVWYICAVYDRPEELARYLRVQGKTNLRPWMLAYVPRWHYGVPFSAGKVAQLVGREPKCRQDRPGLRALPRCWSLYMRGEQLPLFGGESCGGEEL